MSKINKILITTGDIDGIGLEITAKALKKINPSKDVRFYLCTHKDNKLPKKLGKFSLVKTNKNIEDSLNISSKSNEINLIELSNSPAIWVEQSAKLASQKKIQGIVTAPLSKTEIHSAGLRDLGHTDILKRVCKKKDVFMGFKGKKFSVVLITDHIPLKKVSLVWKPDRIKKASLYAITMTNKKDKRRLALLGLNPHAGESALIGTEEQGLKNLKSFFKKNNIDGPIAADIAFSKEAIKKYSVYLAAYHDQGLIPFKSLHKKGDAVHISLGLPFLRVSVDHGTAKDIFGKNIANPKPMYAAIKFAIDEFKKISK